MSEPPALDGGAAGDLLPPAPGSAPAAGGSLRRQPKQRSRDPALRKVSARLACAGEERRARAEQDGTARWQGLRGRTVGSTRRRRAVGRGGAVRPLRSSILAGALLRKGRHRSRSSSDSGEYRLSTAREKEEDEGRVCAQQKGYKRVKSQRERALKALQARAEGERREALYP